MAIHPGRRLGPYEILSAIGAGGMGEVYKARDSRLDRIVAIKVLPAHLADRAFFLLISPTALNCVNALSAKQRRSPA